MRRTRTPIACLAAGLALLPACGAGAGSQTASRGPLGLVVVTRVPAGAGPGGEGAAPGLRYPAGTRIVLESPLPTVEPRVLSRGLAAAGAPRVSPDGDRVLFTGRRPGEGWRIYEARLADGRPREVIAPLAGDAVDPCYLGADRLALVVVPRGGEPPYLATGRRGEQPERITFGPWPVSAPRALPDGRILFTWQAPSDHGVTRYTINPDGTLLEPLCGVEDGRGWADLARVEPEVADPLPDGDGWEPIEAVPVCTTPAPRGRPWAVDHGRGTGTLVCYDAARGDGEHGPATDSPSPTAVAFEALHEGAPRELGRAPVEGDGSFHVCLPADLPLRVRSVDAAGRTLSTSAWFQVRPGEVRACFGCHERRDSAPTNLPVRALAHPPLTLSLPDEEPTG